jgi:hypothetical protein
MDAFDQAVAVMAQQRTAPLAEAKKFLAPTRAAAETAGKEYDALARRLRPSYERAVARYSKAAAVGVRHPNMGPDLDQMRQLLDLGGVGFREVVGAIDHLTESQVGITGYVQTIPGRLATRRANFGALEQVAKRLEIRCRELEEMVRNAAPAPPTLVTAPILKRESEPQPVRVESEFVP